MKHQQPIVTSQLRNAHFAEPCESGYSTTTSSEEGTLQRGYTQVYPKMVPKSSAKEESRTKKVTSRHHKRRTKQNTLPQPSSPLSQASPYSSTSSLTQQYGYQDNDQFYSNDFQRRKPHKQQPIIMSLNDVTDKRHHMTSQHQNFDRRNSIDEMTSSFEDLECDDVHYDINQNVTDGDIRSAAIQEFHQSMNKVRSYQTDKSPEKIGYPNQMDYYRVGDFAPNPYYDPLDISDNMWGQSKKRVTISISPSSSSGTGSPHKPSPIRGILKNPKQSPQYSTSSTPVRKNSLQGSKQFSKSEENLTSIKRITPPSLSSPLSPRDRKSAFVVVQPRTANKPSPPEGSMVAVHPPVQQMLMQNGFESQLDQNDEPRGVDNQTLQMLVTPRNSMQPAPYNPSIQHQPMYNQLPTKQTARPSDLNLKNSAGSSNIVFIPAQIDENGIARPLPQNIPEHHSNHGNNYCARHSNRHHHDNVNNHDHSSHSNSSFDNDHDSTLRSSIHDNSSLKSADSPLPPAEVLSNEAVRLRHFLDKANADELKKRLEKLLESKDPGSIQALTKLFPGTEFTADAAHCVRCHKDFNPRDPGRCILPHPERMVAKISQDDIGADFVCGCCNAGFRLIRMDFYEESTNALLTGHCYSGTHTTDPDSVDYRIDGGAAKSCEEFGCVEFYV